ncbi:competence protein ComJ, partial [Bacillus sp. B-TM1]
MELTISYSQLMLMNYDGDQPYVDWTDEDFERGYAKADGTVNSIVPLLLHYEIYNYYFTSNFTRV